MYFITQIYLLTDGYPSINYVKTYQLVTNCSMVTVLRFSVEDDPVLQIRPKTPIAEALLRARRAYLEAGGKLLSWEELENEIK